MSDSSTSPDDLMPGDVQFADPRQIVRNALKAYLPAEKMDVAEWAERNRFLDNRGGGYVGRWSHDEAPYLVGPMQSLTSRTHLTTAVVGPARSGKTACGQNWIGQSVEIDPADMLVYAQTEDALESYVKREIEPMIDSHPVMKERLGTLPKDRSMKFKRFQGMWVEFLSATYSNMISKSAPRIIATELDAFPKDLGDAYKLFSIRRDSFGTESMVYVESHPDRAQGAEPSQWTDGIMKLYADSDRRTWWWPCPHCNGFSSPTPGAVRQMTLHWPEDAPLDEIREAAALQCPCCGSLIEDRWRRTMNLDGVWVGAGQEISVEGEVTGELLRSDIAGFWITGLMSPFVTGGIGTLAREAAKAQRDYATTGDDKDLREVTVKRLGVPYQSPRRIGSLDAAALADRAEPGLQLGFVPEGVRFLTVGVDIQANRFELLTRGWGVDGESWIIEHRRVAADPATSPEDWDRLLTDLSETLYPLADGSRRGMRVLAIGYDSGGSEGVTLQAYGAWKRARRAMRARMIGQIEGREAWTILPLKGASNLNAASLSVSYPNTQRKDRNAAARGEIPLGSFNPNRFKDDAVTQLQRADAGPWCVHFPYALRAAEPPHPFFEQIVSERRRDDGRWEKLTSSSRNEVLDLLVMTDVMASLHGLRRIDWTRPPAWAAPWDQNVLVKQIIADAEVPKPNQTTDSRPAALPVAAPQAKSTAERMAELARKYGSNG
ncbi:terminase gpA endonuclease subunit [Acetobacter estunensis]|uniref:terminase gpA endonuclease subunit n=1 Tax=Acetobacter estunensis TaxID=104097 RepID=UPI001C2D289A|nr:terminase gpA endonuclease subunit [Acetobacter estunensis]MBV1835643.1 phage terminase large subunit family protein [Acetobacter estunensis]MBV1836096.1 phage terminase large subunit family protein [Acetobacter estunensis]